MPDIDDKSIDVSIHDNSSNAAVTTTDLGGSKRGLDVAGVVQIRDSLVPTQLARVDESGYLLVKTPPPEAPVGTFPVEMMARSTITGSSQVDTPWVIPPNTVIVLQRFLGGQYPASGDASELGLYHSTTGTITTASYLLSLGYVGTGEMNYKDELANTYAGDGVAAIIARRRRMNATAREMYYRWIGYLKYKNTKIIEDSITTNVTATTITDTTKTWTPGALVGFYVVLSKRTPLRITANTNNTLTVVGNSQLAVVQPYQILEFLP